jgi:hypothetical protein
LLEPDEVKALVELLDSLPDKTKEYATEVDRLERFNRQHTGFRHWGSRQPFSWDTAWVKDGARFKWQLAPGWGCYVTDRDEEEMAA